MKPFHVYLLRCADGSYYCGHTDNLEQRLQQHSIGSDGYTVSRRPLQLVWQGEFETREAALVFERQVKGWSRAKKQALIVGDWGQIQLLAKASVVHPSTSAGRTDRGSGRTDGGSGRTDRGP